MSVQRNMMSWGAKWLASKQKRHASREVTYARGLAASVLRAQVGRSSWNVEDVGDTGGLLKIDTRDYLIVPEDLQLDGVQVEPQPGDRITDGDEVWECSSPGGGLPHFSWSGLHKMRLRVHCKGVGETFSTSESS